LPAILATSSLSHAQVSWDADHLGWSYGYSSVYMDLVWDGNDVVPVATQFSDGYGLTYDATVKPVYPYPDPDRIISWGLDTLGHFRVRPVPVQATLTLDVNGKVVNGGGDADHPTSTLSWSTALYYDLDENYRIDVTDPLISGFTLNSRETLTGNGLAVVDDTQTMTDPFVLSPEYSYILLCSQYWSVSDLPSGPATSTFEAGGETGYDGITLTLDATPVPEPAALSLLALGGLILIRHRWRRGRLAA